MEYRVLSSTDVDECHRLRLEALQLEPMAFGQSYEQYVARPLEDIAKQLEPIPNMKFTMGAFDGETLVGTATFMRTESLKFRHAGSVGGMYVTHSARGKGVGKRLMEELIAEARAMEGIEQIVLSVTDPQAAAIGLYKSLGFVTYGIEPRALKVDGVYADLEFMMLRL